MIYFFFKMFVVLFRLILLFFFIGMFEWVDKEGEIFIAVMMARMLSSISYSRGGSTDMIVFDIYVF